jgi:hypothetical protein
MPDAIEALLSSVQTQIGTDLGDFWPTAAEPALIQPLWTREEMVVALANTALLALCLGIALLAVRALRLHRRRLHRQAKRVWAELAAQPLLSDQAPARYSARRQESDYDLAA